MKRLLHISTLLSIIISFTCISASAESEYHPSEVNKEFNHLKVKGNILDVRADVQVFEYNESKEDWILSDEYKNKSRYSLYLNPTKNYQVWFTNVELGTKVLHIDAGTHGVWFKYLDIDFSTDFAYARLYQDIPDYDYIVEIVDNSYASIDTIKESCRDCGASTNSRSND